MFEQMNVEFKNNLPSLNFDKTHYLKFTTKIFPLIDINIGYNNNNLITSATSTQFLGMVVDSHLPWNDHIDKLTGKLSKACYAIRSVQPFVSQETLQMAYFSCFHTVIS
jgi:hypothetical protein